MHNNGSTRFLAGRVAMVTGGVSGMGKAMALAFARAGANVAVGSLQRVSQGQLAPGEVAFLPDQAAFAAVQGELEACGVKAVALGLDVASDESVRQFHADVLERLGPVDILANAAGVTAEQAVCGHSDALWNKVIEVNLNGVFRTTRLCLPGMMERGWGRIINIASTAASVGAPTSAAYCASKAGVVGFTRCVALEGAAQGVTCNAISPTWVDTGFGKDWMAHIAEGVQGRSREAYIDEVKAQNPQKRLIQPEEIGELALFLCREEARGITMQDLTVSAGSLW